MTINPAKKKQDVKYAELELDLYLPELQIISENPVKETASTAIFDIATCEWLQL